MSKILVVGTGPLYSPEQKLFCGLSFRTWHLTSPLRDAGHAVELVVLPTEGHPSEGGGGVVSTARHGTFNYSILRSNAPDDVIPVLQGIVGSNQYDGIVAVNSTAAAMVARLQTPTPVWFDIAGHLMGEAQTKCAVHQDDQFLEHFWRRQRSILRRGDRFSVSSHKQMYALVGELGAVGRLNRHTCSHPFVSVIPVAAAEQFLMLDLPLPEKHFRGPVFPEDAFAVLWTGGFNTWTDVKSLAASLSLAMEQVPRMRFISTGGAIPGHDEVSYPAFVEEMKRSGFEDRCHFLGWIEGGELPFLYSECDLGLNLDALNYETLLGTRFRLVNMMAAGLPVLTTLGTELSEMIAENRLGYTVRIGKIQEFADAIHRAYRNALERRNLGQRARAFCRENFSAEGVTKSVAKWAAAPSGAPDNLEKIRLYPHVKNPADVALNELEREVQLVQGGALQELEILRSKVAELEGSRLYKLRQKVQTAKQKLGA